MNYTTVIKKDTPVVVRSYTSGVVVGRLFDGEQGTVVLTDWRWLRSWRGVGGSGSIYDLVASDVVPHDRGPLTPDLSVLQQADVMVISDEAYRRLAHG